MITTLIVILSANSPYGTFITIGKCIPTYLPATVGHRPPLITRELGTLLP